MEHPANYPVRVCLLCRVTVRASASRMRHVFNMHTERCSEATPEQRAEFRRLGRWPKRQKNARWIAQSLDLFFEWVRA